MSDEITESVEVEVPSLAVESTSAVEGSEESKVKTDATGRLHGEDGKFVSKQEQEQDDPTYLKNQIEAHRQAAEIARRREIEAEHRRAQAEGQARSRQQDAVQAQYDAILNAIGAANAEAESAQRDLESAMAAGDPKGLGDAQRRLSRAEARLVQLEDGKIAYEERQNQMRAWAEHQRRNPPPQPRPITIDEHISRMPNLSDGERGWLRQHPDLLTDPVKNASLTHFFFESQKQGLERGTQAYFKYLDESLGYRVRNESTKETEKQERKSPPVAAPPSRTAQEGDSPTRVTLTPQEREAAKISGISEVDYARNKLKLNKLKAEGYYSESR